MVIRDTMDLTLNMADGKQYDSKRAYERAVTRAGCDIIGNDTSYNHEREWKPTITKSDVKQALDQLRGRNG